MKLTIIIDDFDYISSEPYQGQLHSRIIKEHECQYVTLQNLLDSKVRPAHENIFIALKCRNTITHRHKISSWIDKRNCVIQDYDPWVFMEDNTPYSGGYEKIIDTIDNCSFAIPNNFWCKIVKETYGIKTIPFKLGMSPELCAFNSWKNRNKSLEFKGSKYPVREKNFKKLQTYIPVNWSQDKVYPYQNFLNYLSDVKIWAHDESEKITSNNISYCRNWLWPKALEILSRGCFLIRDWQQEAEWYEIDKLPTSFLYNDIKNSKDKLEKIFSMKDDERDDRIHETVSWIKNQDFYGRICKEMNFWWQS
jgi:hypothetical protein